MRVAYKLNFTPQATVLGATADETRERKNLPSMLEQKQPCRFLFDEKKKKSDAGSHAILDH